MLSRMRKPGGNRVTFFFYINEASSQFSIGTTVISRILKDIIDIILRYGYGLICPNSIINILFSTMY